MAAKTRGLPGQLHPNYIPSPTKMKTTFILPLDYSWPLAAGAACVIAERAQRQFRAHAPRQTAYAGAQRHPPRSRLGFGKPRPHHSCQSRKDQLLENRGR